MRRSSGSHTVVRGPWTNWNIDQQRISVGRRKLLNFQWVGGKVMKEQAETRARSAHVQSSPAAGTGSYHFLRFHRQQQYSVFPTQQIVDDVENSRRQLNFTRRLLRLNCHFPLPYVQPLTSMDFCSEFKSTHKHLKLCTDQFALANTITLQVGFMSL